MTSLLSADRIERAAIEIDPVFRNSPQFVSEPLGEALRVRVLVKVETVNPIRSFKGRGTDFFLKQLDPRPARVVCASAGNFGQGLAFAARSHGAACDVFAAQTANPLKVERMRALGAQVHVAGHDFDAAKQAARAYAAHEGFFFVEDGRELSIAEGAGSIAVEMCRWPERLEAVVIPLGNGALLGGMATWFKAYSPETRVIGVCAHQAPAMERSWKSGVPVETARADTIADGIAVRVPVPEALDYLRPVVDDIVLVTEEALRDAMRAVFLTTGLVVEPAGVAGVAALLEHAHLRSSGLVATPLCGGNVTPAQMREWGTIQAE